MTAARAAILAAVRRALDNPLDDPAAIRAEAAALLDPADAIRPARPGSDASAQAVVGLFAEQIVRETLGGTLRRVAVMQAVPGAVAQYLAERGLPAVIALQPAVALRDLDWTGLAITPGMAPDQVAGVGLARWGIAETGSLVFHSGPDTPVLFHFLPLHHVAVLLASAIVPYLEDYVAAAGPAPRNANLITGASGTTDIEGSYVRGAHGPGFLHVILVDDLRG